MEIEDTLPIIFILDSETFDSQQCIYRFLIWNSSLLNKDHVITHGDKLKREFLYNGNHFFITDIKTREILCTLYLDEKMFSHWMSLIHIKYGFMLLFSNDKSFYLFDRVDDNINISLFRNELKYHLYHYTLRLVFPNGFDFLIFHAVY